LSRLILTDIFVSVYFFVLHVFYLPVIWAFNISIKPSYTLNVSKNSYAKTKSQVLLLKANLMKCHIFFLCWQFWCWKIYPHC